MTNKKSKNYANAIEKIDNDFISIIFEIEKNFIEPICDRYRLIFSSQQNSIFWHFESIYSRPLGGFYIIYDNSSSVESFMTKDDVKKFKELVKLLEMKMGNGILGEHVGSYNPGF